MALTDLFRAARRASEPTPGATERVLRRVQTEDPAVRGLLTGVGAPDAAGSRRVLARVRATRRLRRWRRLGLAVALAMVTLVPLTAKTPRSLATPLSTQNTPLTDAVAVVAEGSGYVGGTELAPHITWERGRLDLTVDPDAGVHLVVDTPETRVTVLGTVFAVVRDPLGTQVEVQRGRVQVDCRSGRVVRLGADETTICWPSTLAGLLGRARALEARAASSAEILATLERALATPGPEAVRGEVLAHQIRLFTSDGRAADALQVAQKYLDEGHLPRRDEVDAFITSLSQPGAAP